MANRLLRQFQYGFENKIVSVFCKFAVGASGAPTLDVAKSKGITSITRNSAGVYTILFNDNFVELFGASPTIILASGSQAAGAGFVVRDSSVATSAKTVQIQFQDGTFAAADIASGASVIVKFDFLDSAKLL